MAESIDQIKGIDPGDGGDGPVPRVLGVLQSRLGGAGTLREGPPRDGGGTSPSRGQGSHTEPVAALYNLPRNVSIRFILDEETHEVSALIVDRDSGEIIRTVPPDKLLDLARRGGRVTGMFVEARL